MVAFGFRGSYSLKTVQIVGTKPKLCKYFNAVNMLCSKCVEILQMFAEFRKIYVFLQSLCLDHLFIYLFIYSLSEYLFSYDLLSLCLGANAGWWKRRLR